MDGEAQQSLSETVGIVLCSATLSSYSINVKCVGPGQVLFLKSSFSIYKMDKIMIANFGCFI